MAFVPTANTARVDIRQMIFGQLIENTLYFLNTGEWSADDLALLAVTVATWFVGQVMPNLSNELTLREVVARDISAEDGEQVVDVSLTGSAGGSPDAAAPSNVALAVSFRTNQSGRSFRGRNFIAGLCGTNVTENEVTTSVGDAIVTAYNGLNAAVGAGGLPDVVWCVVSLFAAGAPRLAGLATQITVATLTDYFLDSQRRRLTGRGH